MKYQQGDVLLTKIDEPDEKDTIRNLQLKKDIMNKVVIRVRDVDIDIKDKD